MEPINVPGTRLRMFHLFPPQPLPIGLDVGSESVKMLQLAIGPAGLAVAAAVRMLIPDDAKGDPDKRVAFAGDTLRAALRRHRFRGRRVVAALPKDVVHYKTHRLPPMPPAELAMAARIDARDLFRFDPDSADVQCLDAGEVRQQGGERRHEVILVAAGKKYLDPFVRTLHRAGARIESLEVEPTALRRAAARVGGGASGDATPPQLLLDVGAAESRVMIRHGGHVREFETIHMGADHFRTAVSRKLGLPPAEAEQLRRRAAAQAAAGEPANGIQQGIYEATRHAVETIAREVLAALRHHAATFRGPAPVRVDLIGGEAGNAQFRSSLSAALPMPVQPVDLFEGIDASAIAPSDRTQTMGEWAVALGLALKPIAATEIRRRRDADGVSTSRPRSEPETPVLATLGGSSARSGGVQ